MADLELESPFPELLTDARDYERKKKTVCCIGTCGWRGWRWLNVLLQLNAMKPPERDQVALRLVYSAENQGLEMLARCKALVNLEVLIGERCAPTHTLCLLALTLIAEVQFRRVWGFGFFPAS